jgi:hypothetical protein
MLQDKDNSHISLRDYFAGLAMQAIMTAQSQAFEIDEISVIAYSMADSMLERRDSAKEHAFYTRKRI